MHALPSSQLASATWANLQAPLTHASDVHPFLSSQSPSTLHAPPQLAMGAKTQPPLVTSQLSVVQALPSSQAPEPETPLHTPFLHTSLLVQETPSSQVPPSAMAIPLHLPVFVSQLSVVQALPSLQAIGVPVQLPLAQVSPVVQGKPSSQGEPSAVWLDVQTPVLISQLSDVQPLPSSQSALLVHLSPVHLLVGVKTQALFLASQVSVVHRLLSSQRRGLPCAQTPALHTWSISQNP